MKVALSVTGGSLVSHPASTHDDLEVVVAEFEVVPFFLPSHVPASSGPTLSDIPHLTLAALHQRAVLVPLYETVSGLSMRSIAGGAWPPDI